jgi:hypothetical protein
MVGPGCPEYVTGSNDYLLVLKRFEECMLSPLAAMVARAVTFVLVDGCDLWEVRCRVCWRSSQ